MVTLVHILEGSVTLENALVNVMHIMARKKKEDIHVHTHTHTHIYIYI